MSDSAGEINRNQSESPRTIERVEEEEAMSRD